MKNNYDVKTPLTFVLMFLLLMNLAINSLLKILLHVYANPKVHALSVNKKKIRL